MGEKTTPLVKQDSKDLSYAFFRPFGSQQFLNLIGSQGTKMIKDHQPNNQRTSSKNQTKRFSTFAHQWKLTMCVAEKSYGVLSKLNAFGVPLLGNWKVSGF